MQMAESILTTVHLWLSSEHLTATPRRRSSSPGQRRRNSKTRRSQSLSRPGSAAPSVKSECGGTAPNTWCPTAPYGLAPILNVGVPPLPGSTFPKGTFMVQPAICVNGRWSPVGLISDKTQGAVVEEVNRLWVERESFIFRDKDAAPDLWPDWEVMNQAREGYVRKPKKEPYQEFGGEGRGDEWYGEGYQSGYPVQEQPQVFQDFQEPLENPQDYYEEEEDGPNNSEFFDE